VIARFLPNASGRACPAPTPRPCRARHASRSRRVLPPPPGNKSTVTVLESLGPPVPTGLSDGCLGSFWQWAPIKAALAGAAPEGMSSDRHHKRVPESAGYRVAHVRASRSADNRKVSPRSVITVLATVSLPELCVLVTAVLEPATPKPRAASSSGGSPNLRPARESVDSAQQPGKYAAGSHLDETPDAVSREMANGFQPPHG